jgi:CubicO group peptidase (beta-lactamase class C family)
MFRRAVFCVTAFTSAAFGVHVAGQRGAPIQRPALPNRPPAEHFPGRFDWIHKKPAEVGMDAAGLDAAVKLAIDSENPATRNMLLYDMARFGYLFLHNGAWNGRRIVSEKWIQMARTPGPANATYGFANWFLNRAGSRCRRLRNRRSIS